MSIIFKRYLVSHPDGGEQVIESPCAGAAIEYYLATHGMLGYDKPPSVTRTKLPADAASTEVKFREIMGDPNGWMILNQHHAWKEKRAR